MQVLQGMSTDHMIIILPSALIAMYLIISLQKFLCTRDNRYLGLILPVGCFIASTILAFRPLVVGDTDQSGLLVFCIRMWLTFNISTILFGFQYIRERRQKRIMAEVSAIQGEVQQDNPSVDPALNASFQETDEDEDEETRAKREYEAKIARFRNRM